MSHCNAARILASGFTDQAVVAAATATIATHPLAGADRRTTPVSTSTITVT